jgi:hypothetical protein
LLNLIQSGSRGGQHREPRQHNQEQDDCGCGAVGLAAVVWMGLADEVSAQQFEDDGTQKKFSVVGGAQT